MQVTLQEGRVVHSPSLLDADNCAGIATLHELVQHVMSGYLQVCITGHCAAFASLRPALT